MSVDIGNNLSVNTRKGRRSTPASAVAILPGFSLALVMLQRIRTTKPEFYRHHDLFEAEQETGLPLRLAFQALWTCCDREGRFKWRPHELKVCCLPYDDVDFSRVLDALATRGYLVKYASGDASYGCVPTFTEHQVINNREKESVLPDPAASTSEIKTSTRGRRVDDACAKSESGTGTGTEGKGTEGKGTEGNTSSVASGDVSVTPEQFMERWNRFASKHPKLKSIRVMSDPRRKKLAARQKKPSWFTDFKASLAQLPLGGDGWQPTVDWLLENENNVYRLLEGEFSWRDSDDPAKKRRKDNLRKVEAETREERLAEEKRKRNQQVRATREAIENTLRPQDGNGAEQHGSSLLAGLDDEELPANGAGK